MAVWTVGVQTKNSHVMSKKEQKESERSTDYSMEEIKQNILAELSSYITEATPEAKRGSELQES